MANDNTPAVAITSVIARRYGGCNLCTYGEKEAPAAVIQVEFKTGYHSTSTLRYCKRHFLQVLEELNRLAEPALNPHSGSSC